MSEQLSGERAVAHLLRRAGFGPALATWPEWRELSFDEAVERLFAGLDTPVQDDPPGFDPFDPGTIQRTWLERMRSDEAPLAEKLAFFWHGHFATSDAKIVEPELMWKQYKLFREKGAGSLRELVLAVCRDVAMIRWLDGNANRKGHANENFGRELMELFTLGIGNYTETDIREVARAFTGWNSRHHEFVFRPEFHDDGEKTIFGQAGNWDGDDVVDLLMAQPACARFIARKLLRFFSHPNPTDMEVDIVAVTMQGSGMSVKAALGAIFRAQPFRDPANHRALVRSPVEFSVGALRAVGAEEVPATVMESCGLMGQYLFRPPSVKGWPSGIGWLSSTAVVERLKVAREIARRAPEERADAIVDVAFAGDVPQGLEGALARATGRDRIALALGSPEFQMA